MPEIHKAGRGGAAMLAAGRARSTLPGRRRVEVGDQRRVSGAHRTQKPQCLCVHLSPRPAGATGAQAGRLGYSVSGSQVKAMVRLRRRRAQQELRARHGTNRVGRCAGAGRLATVTGTSCGAANRHTAFGWLWHSALHSAPGRFIDLLVPVVIIIVPAACWHAFGTGGFPAMPVPP